jgi:ligand-binding sensor domain-containing protein/DNA-binding CsgD family transcriptional regulator
MMRTPFRLLGILFLCTTVLSGQSYPGRFHRFEHLTLREGRASLSAFSSICQDKEGFLWFGTNAGLARYDGYRFISFNPQSVSESSAAPVGVFPATPARSGDLLVGTNGRGLFRFLRDSGIFVPYGHDPLDRASPMDGIILAVQEDPQGNLWLGTRTHGLEKWDRNTQSFSRVPLEPSADTIWDVLVDSRGNIWAGTLDAGLFRIDAGTGAAINYRFTPDDPSSLGSNIVWTIFEDGEGEIWAGTKGGGLNRWDRTGERFTRFLGAGDFPRDLAGQTITAIAEDGAGRLWLGTSSDGLRIWDRRNGEYVLCKHDPQDPESLSDDGVTSIYRDASGVLWVATVRGGLNKCLTGKAKFPHYKHDLFNPLSLGDNDVRSLWRGPTGTLWVGTGAGLDRMDEISGGVTRCYKSLNGAQGLGSDKILVVMGDNHGNIWIGTMSGGLDKVTPGSGTITHYHHNRANRNSLSDNWVQALWSDASVPDVLWVGTHGGLNRLETQTSRWTQFVNDPQDAASLSNNIITAISEDRQGYLWVGTQWGLNRLDKKSGRCERYIHRLEDTPGTSISDNIIHCVLEDHRGIIWVGTDNGLNGFDPATGGWRYFAQKEGLGGEVVCGILEDSGGSLWISTNRGLSRLEPQTGKMANFGTRDGLQGPAFNPGASFRGPDGCLYFGGANGFNIIAPAEIREDPFVPPVAWTAYYQGGFEVKPVQSLSTLRELTLPHNASFPVLEFAALSFSAPEMNTFAYRLEPRDREWVPLGTSNRVSLSGVGTGRYTLRVKAANPDGVWNETGIGIAVLVQAPFWRTWWFMLITGAFVVSGTALVVAMRRKIRSLTMAAGESPEGVVETYNLTSREREILRLVLQGSDNKDIGRKLFISGSTVRNHIYNIYQKLGVRNRIELVNRVAGDARKKTKK